MEKQNIINYLAIIPARAGSKRIPRKNLINFNGKPLIFYTILAARKAKKVDKIFLSTDSAEIANYATKMGLAVDQLRPKNLAQDKSSLQDVVTYCLKKLQKEDIQVKNIVLLQPTSPFRTAKDIDQAISLYETKKADTVTSISFAREHPFYAWKMKNGLLLSLFNQKLMTGHRATFPEIFFENGAIYIFSSQLALKGQIYGKKVIGYLMDEKHSVDIDTYDNLNYAKYLMRKK